MDKIGGILKGNFKMFPYLFCKEKKRYFSKNLN